MAMPTATRAITLSVKYRIYQQRETRHKMRPPLLLLAVNEQHEADPSRDER